VPAIHPRARRVRGQIEKLRRVLRYRLVIPVFRSRHTPEYTARGVANGVFWGLTPSVGVQTIEILGTWLIGRSLFGKDSSLLQALIWVWVNNPVTMIPMYYVFYLTGLWLLGKSGSVEGYDSFVALWDANSTTSWVDRVTALARSIGAPMALGSLPYAAVGSALSYRWAVRVVRRRQEKVRRRLAIDSATT
jgi:uncharacterized protein (DUF2062 family)